MRKVKLEITVELTDEFTEDVKYIRPIGLILDYLVLELHHDGEGKIGEIIDVTLLKDER